jgi:hypothetical protein
MTEQLPADNTCDTEIDSRIIKLVDKCARLKTAKDSVDKAFKMAKSELETLCDERKLKEIVTTNTSVKITKSRRFREYRNVDAVLELIPEEVREDTMSLDRKKINELIKLGVLPNAIKDEELYSETMTTTFKRL